MGLYKFENGDLELLALGALEDERIEGLLLMLNDNRLNLREFQEIEDKLEFLAHENEIESPADLKGLIKNRIFESKNKTTFKRLIRLNWIRYAAMLLFILSVGINLWVLNKNLGKDSLSQTITLSSRNELSDNLPFDEIVFEELFQFLEIGLKKNACAMDYKLTIAYLTSKGLNTKENLSYLNSHEGHCDCEVLMNVSQMFPLENYKHGNIVPRSHRAAEIKVSLLGLTRTASLLALNDIK